MDEAIAEIELLMKIKPACGLSRAPVNSKESSVLSPLVEHPRGEFFAVWKCVGNYMTNTTCSIGII